MAIIQALLAFVSRSLGRITSAIFGWAVVVLFGQTSPREQTLLSALVGAAAAWPILLLGIAIPKIAVVVLGFVPLPEWVPKSAVRIAWVVLAVGVPIAVGVTMAMRGRDVSALEPLRTNGQPATRESVVTRLLRGFPITIAIAAAFLVVFVTVPVLRVIAFVRRRIDLQVPLITSAHHYDAIAARTARVLDEHGFTVQRRRQRLTAQAGRLRHAIARVTEHPERRGCRAHHSRMKKLLERGAGRLREPAAPYHSYL